MTDRYAAPAVPSEGLDFNELQGSLMLIRVVYLEDHVPNVNTKPGEKSPAIRADVTILDGRLAGKEYPDALIFPRVMQGQLRSRVGQLVLGRLTKGEAQPGKNPPWKLDPATQQDVQVADAYMARKSQPQVTSVSGPTSGPSQSAQPPF